MYNHSSEANGSYLASFLNFKFMITNCYQFNIIKEFFLLLTEPKSALQFIEPITTYLSDR